MTQRYGDLVEAITNVRFHPVRLHEGYDMHEVDDLLDAVIATLGRGEPVAGIIAGARLSHVRLREGYDIAEVDRFLAELLRMADPDGSNSSIVPPPGAPVVPEQRSRLGQFFGRR